MSDKTHKAYAFDIDENLLHTNTTVYVEQLTEYGWKKIEIPESELKVTVGEFGYRYPNDDPEQCYHDMRGIGKLQEHIFNALSDGRFGPSREKFKAANKQASPISLITARGHPVEALRAVHKDMILETFDRAEFEEFLDNFRHRLQTKEKKEKKLLDSFLNMNYYAPCSDPEFLQNIRRTWSDPMPEKKVIAFKTFIEHIRNLNEQGLTNPHKKMIKIGFSDDSEPNLSAVENAIRWDLVNKYPDIIFALYNTNDPEFIKKTIYHSKKK